MVRRALRKNLGWFSGMGKDAIGVVQGIGRAFAGSGIEWGTDMVSSKYCVLC